MNNHPLTTNELEDFSPYHTHDHKESAYASAMRALQDSLKKSELENLHLKEKLSQSQFLEEELRHARLENQKLKEHLKILESSAQHSESELLRSKEHMEIDRQNTQLQIEYLQSQLLSKDDEVAKKQQEYRHERDVLEEEVSQAKRVISSLEGAVSFLKENSNNQRSQLQKNIEELEQKHSKQVSGLTAKIKKLRTQNKKLTELNDTQTKQLLKNELNGQLSDRGRNFSLKRISRKKKIKKHNSVKQFETQKESGLLPQISHVENEIAALNRNYRNLLGSINEDTTDLPSLKNDIDRVIADIEVKSNLLVDLKKRHQAFLKGKLNS